jgi:hypothetical protein
MEQELKIVIKGDVVQVTKSLNELQKEFNDLEKQLKTKTGQAFIDTNKELDRLRLTMDKVKNIGRTGFNEFGDAAQGAGKGIKNVGQAAVSAAPALNSLGQVARDLPFGFIAIQNNLPIVADQFGALIKSSGGAGSALKALGASLIGPVGITFAIGAVIAGITALVQKYGSIRAAVDALIKGGDKLYQQQLLLAKVSEEANKNAGEEISRYKFLAQTAANTALSLNVRKDAIKELQEQYGAYLGNLTQEDILNGKLAASTDDVTNALRNKALAQAAVAKAGELSGKQLSFLEEEEKYNARILTLETRREKEKGKFRSTQGGTTDVAAETQRVIDAETKLRDAVRKSRIEVEAQIDALFKRAQTANAAAGVGAIAPGKTEAERAKAAKEATDKAAKAAKDLRDKQIAAEKELLEIQTRRLEQELKGIGTITDAYLAQQKKIAINKAQIQILGANTDAAKTEIRASLEELLIQITDEFNSGRIRAGQIDFTSLLNIDPVEGAKRLAALLKSTTADAFSQATSTQGQVIGKIQIYPSTQVQQDIANLDATKAKVAEISSTFDSVLNPAIDAAFNALEQGKNVVQAIGESFKRLIVQIGATILKAAILAAILAATGLGAPFGAAAGSAGAFGKIFSGLLGIGQTAAPGGGFASGGFASGGTRTPNFGQVAGGGFSVNVTGQFVQRGPDLVATFNQASQTIRRVG